MKNNWQKKVEEFFSMKVSLAFKKFIKEIWGFLTPVLYLILWVFILKIAKDLLGETALNNNFFLLISLAILFMGILAKSTSWSLGGENGIKADSTSKKVEFCVDGICTIKVFDNDPDVKEKMISDIGKTVMEIVKSSRKTNEK